MVRCGRYMKLMSCNNKPKYMTKQRPEEKQQQQQKQKQQRRGTEKKNSALHVVRSGKGRERGREEKEGKGEGEQRAGRVHQPGLK